jgi:hypothetical protein
LIEVALEAIQVIRPKPAISSEPVVEFDQRFNTNSIHASLGVDAGLDQSRLPEHSQVLRHSRLAQPELFNELTDGSLAVSKDLKDGHPIGLNQRLKSTRVGHDGDYALMRIYLSSHVRC